MTPAGLTTKILWILFQFKFGHAILQRIVWFYRELTDNQSLDILHDDMYEACLKLDPLYRSALPNCFEAKEYMRVTGSAYWRAFHFIVERTHSCIDIPCSHILETTLNSWTALIIAAIIIVVYSQALVSKLKKLKIPSFPSPSSSSKLLPLLPSSLSTPVSIPIQDENDFLVKKKQ